MSVRVSQSDLAELLGVAQPTVSQATKNGHKIRGFPVRAWAEYDGAGRVSGYEIPPAAQQAIFNGNGRYTARDEALSVRSNAPAASPAASPAAQLGVPDELAEWALVQRLHHEMEMQRPAVPETTVSLLPPGEDYRHPVGFGGAAYVAATAIREDNATAHAGILTLAAGSGALIGMAATTENQALGALFGALFGFGVGIIGLQIETPITEQRP